MKKLFDLTNDELREFDKNTLGYMLVELENLFEEYLDDYESLQESKAILDASIERIENTIIGVRRLTPLEAYKLDSGREMSRRLSEDLLEHQMKIDEYKYHIDRVWGVLTPC